MKLINFSAWQPDFRSNDACYNNAAVS